MTVWRLGKALSVTGKDTCYGSYEGRERMSHSSEKLDGCPITEAYQALPPPTTRGLRRTSRAPRVNVLRSRRLRDPSGYQPRGIGVPRAQTYP